MTTTLEEAYRRHHSSHEREGFAILEEERGALFCRLIGTGKKVLDIGCRDGTLTRHFIAGNDVTGADIDAHALERAAGMLGIRTMQFDLNGPNWPFEPASFDVVVAAEVLEHLFNPEQVLEHISRILKPGGMLVGSVPNAFSLKCRLRYLVGSKRGTPLADPMHINQFSWQEMKGLLDDEFVRVSLMPLGRKTGGLRDIAPSLFAFGIAFRAFTQ